MQVDLVCPSDDTEPLLELSVLLGSDSFAGMDSEDANWTWKACSGDEDNRGGNEDYRGSCNRDGEGRNGVDVDVGEDGPDNNGSMLLIK